MMLSPPMSHSKSQQKRQNVRQIKTDNHYPSPMSDSLSPREVDKIDEVSSPEQKIVKHNHTDSTDKEILSPESNYEEDIEDDMDEYEKTVQTIIEMEENILQSHVSFIQVSLFGKVFSNRYQQDVGKCSTPF